MLSALSDVDTPDINKEAGKARDLILKSKMRSQNLKEEDEVEEQDEEVEPVQEILLPSVFYQNIMNMYPPNPLLPKSFHAQDESPRSGGLCKFLKLTKFRGVDQGRSKFRTEAAKIEKL